MATKAAKRTNVKTEAAAAPPPSKKTASKKKMSKPAARGAKAKAK